jgi:hypothetical protein
LEGQSCPLMETKMQMNEFNETFPTLQGGDNLAKFIGRQVRFSGTKDSDGEIHKFGIFEVVGTQVDWRGQPCLRVKCISFRGKPFADKFGHVMPLSRIAFV